MRMKIGLAGIGMMFGCLTAACGNGGPTGVRVGAERRAGAVRSEGYFHNGGNDGITTQSDTTTRGIGGFGSGN